MKKVLIGFCVLWGLFSIFILKVGDCPQEIKTVEFEALDAQMMMDVIVRSTEIVESRNAGIEISYDDAQELMRIAQAEAEGDGIEGKAMVMAVILNRVKDSRFPNNVHDVIFQDKQFSPISDGRYWKVEIDRDCHLALAEIEQGNYSHIDALYFENAKDSWQSQQCKYLYTVGNHRFYKN